MEKVVNKKIVDDIKEENEDDIKLTSKKRRRSFNKSDDANESQNPQKQIHSAETKKNK